MVGILSAAFRSAVKDGALKITVKDNGQGIAPDVIDQTFDP
jgi:C4-dicarboxylate-specific signal transduction histidine kinase